MTDNKADGSYYVPQAIPKFSESMHRLAKILADLGLDERHDVLFILYELDKAHKTELNHTSKSEFHRGYRSGVQHRAACEKKLDLDRRKGIRIIDEINKACNYDGKILSDIRYLIGGDIYDEIDSLK